MTDYEVTVCTGNIQYANTFNNIYIKLVGTNGESNHTWLWNISGPLNFSCGAESTFTLSCAESIYELLMIELDKQHGIFPQVAWFPSMVKIKSPEGSIFNFPIYRWITDSEAHIFREGKALLVFQDKHALGKYSRNKELQQRAEDYKWDVYADGIPHCMKAETTEGLPYEVQFSFTKSTEFLFTAAQGLLELKLDGLINNTDKWTSLDDIYQVFCCKSNDVSVYVHKHWREDDFFAYQFINGVNPILIKRCTVIPENFPVTESMVFIHGPHSLEEELKNGNIYLVDYKLLDGVEANTINGKKQYLMAPLVLLQKTPDDKLMPIAIQLKQTPGEDNPIFFPTDPVHDWLLAKIFVRSADFNYHEMISHLLRTHLLAEVFAVSLLRNMPMVHPLYKLLIPHTRYTLQINLMARNLLISENGSFTKFAACGGKGMFTMLRRATASLTYSSLCIPDDIAERGVEALPDYYYRDDGLKLWEIIYKVLISASEEGFSAGLIKVPTYDGGSFSMSLVQPADDVVELRESYANASIWRNVHMERLSKAVTLVNITRLRVSVDIFSNYVTEYLTVAFIGIFQYTKNYKKIASIRFVKGILTYYYKSDADVQKDTELKKWISDIFVQGFLSNEDTGIPQEFTTVSSLVKFVTMVIFTCSLQHAAVNSGQYDFGAWMPNTPISMQLPPPTTKGDTTMETILETLPDINVTVQGMAVLHLLSKQSSDFVPLGQYPDQEFFEEVPCKLIKKFQGGLEVQSVIIKVRNDGLDLPYSYMNPTLTENSVAV